MVKDGHWYLIQIDAADSLYTSALESDEAYQMLREWDDTIVDPVKPPEQFRAFLGTIIRDVFTRDLLLQHRMTHPTDHLREIAEAYENFAKPRMLNGEVLLDVKLVNMEGLVLIHLGKVAAPTLKLERW